MTELQHKTLEAKAVATDKGEFTAFAATYGTDRVNDRIVFGAFAKTIAAWRASGKRIPVHWSHDDSAANVIGGIDPGQLEEIEGEGLFVAGKLDLEDSEVAREAWRSMKDNRVALSFGYMTTRERKAKDGVNELLELDLFEVSIVSGPANADTRLLSLKAVDRDDGTTVVVAETVTEEPEAPTEEPVPVEEPPSAEELRKQTFDFALEMAGGATKAHDGDDAGLAALEEALKDRRVQLALWKALKSIAETGELPTPEPAPEPVDAETLRKRSFDVALELAKSPNGTKSAPAKVEAPADNTVDSSTREMVQTLIDGLKAAGVIEKPEPEAEPVVEPPPEQTGEEPPKTSETSAVEDGKDEEPPKAKSAPQDPLRKRTFDLALGISNGGMRVPSHLPEPEPEPEPLNEAELRRRSLKAALAIARGD